MNPTRNIESDLQVPIEEYDRARSDQAVSEKYAPLSLFQEPLWFFEQLEPGTPTHNITQVFELAGPLNVNALERSFVEIVRRHDVFRTSFTTIDGQPVQAIAPDAALTLRLVDLQKLPKQSADAEFKYLSTAEARHPFDIRQRPLLRVTLLRLNQERHILLLMLHHIVSDGWSMGLLTGELDALYGAFQCGTSSPLPKLKEQYGEFAAWQRRWIEGKEAAGQLSYWRKQLGGKLPILELPVDRPRPSVQTFHGARYPIKLSKELAESIQTLCRREKVTLFMTLLAAFDTLLYRYTQEDDIAVGTFIANRKRTETEHTIGLFVNNLVLRTDLSGNPTFRELLSRVRAVMLAAYEHQDLPFEKLQGQLQPIRNTSRTPLFQVSFALQNAPKATVRLLNLDVKPLEFHSATAKFDMSLYLWESHQGLGGRWEYNTDLFEETTIGRMMRHFEMLLRGIVRDPESRICDLPLLTRAEQFQFLEEFNNTRAGNTNGTSIPELFEDRVRRSPSAPCVTFRNNTITYAELGRRSTRLACILQSLGVGPEVVVGLAIDSPLNFCVGLLGILKAGGAFATLPRDCAGECLNAWRPTTRPQIVVTDCSEADVPEKLALHIVRLDNEYFRLADAIDEYIPIVPMSDGLACVTAADGSHGPSLWQMHSHRALCNLAYSLLQSLPLAEHDRILVMSPPGCVFTVCHLLWTWSAGACVVFPSTAIEQDDSTRVDKIVPQQITTWIGDSRQLSRLVHLQYAAVWQPLRHIVCSDEVMPSDLSEQVLSQSHASLHFLYKTPRLPVVSHRQCHNSSDVTPTKIEGPLQTSRIYVLDPYLYPVPVSVAGEMHFGGDNLPRGFLDRPRRTAEIFLPDPYCREPGRRLVRLEVRAK